MDQVLSAPLTYGIDSAIVPAATTAAEAFAVLKAHAERHGVGALAEELARRALRVTAGADFAVARDALEALARRLDSAREDGWMVRAVTRDGDYRVSQRGRRGRTYEVWLGAVDAADSSCTCPDFAKASLGVCKHVLAVIERGRAIRTGSHRALRWDPVRPMTGPGDWLARVWFDPRSGARIPRQLAGVLQPAQAGRPIDPACIGEPRARLATVERLLAAIHANARLAEPALPRLLERERERLRGALARGLERRELPRLLRGLKQKLFSYQREGVERFLAAGRLLLADDMGLGKTAQAIAACHVLVRAGHVTRAVVVVPASLKPQWQREWRAFTDVALTVVDGHPDQRASVYRARGPAVLLVNYEQLLRDLPQVQAFAPELVILDEAQRIKNWQTKTAAVVKRLEPAWRLVLTGTPMENRLDELASIMEWVDEAAMEPRWRLASWHAVRADGSREVTGARNLETLRARLAPSMLRRVRRDVLDQLPPRRDMTIGLALTAEQVAAHADLEAPVARIAARARRRPLTRAEFLQLMQLLAQQRMICNGMALRDFAAVWPDLERVRRRSEPVLASLCSPKLLELRDRLIDLTVTQERKVVVFSQWRRMLQLAAWVSADALGAAGVRSVFFSGQESPRRRDENLVDFHDDPSTRVLFATDAGGVGLNLQRAASSCINLELPWNPAVLEQRIGRIYRLGQTQPVEIYNLVAASGIEARIAKLVGDKRALFTGLFDGTSDEVPFETSGSFLAQVHKLVDGEGAGMTAPGELLAGDSEVADEPDDPERPAATEDLEVRAAAVLGAIDVRGSGERGPDVTGPGVGTATLDLAEFATTLSQIAIRPLDGGRVSVELPRQAAAALGGMLRALAAAVERTPGEATSGDAGGGGA